jgi:acyl-CoA synthetase (AMP-forming)/AMP-acid ligase II
MSGSELVKLLEKSALTHAERPAFIEQGSRISYQAFWRMVGETARALEAQGIGGGERVAFRMGNTVRDMAAGLGVITAGAALIPVPFQAAEPEKLEYIRECLATHDLVVSETGPQVMSVQTEHPESITEALRRAVIIRPTSGTTGRRKGVILSADSITGRINALNSVLRIGPADTILWTLPVSFHLVVSILLYLIHGATVVLAENQYPDTLLGLAKLHPVTVLYGSPRQFSMLSSDRSGKTFPFLRWAVSTGTFLPEGVAHAFFDRFGHPLRQAYGLIEVGIAALNASMPWAPFDSVGEPVPGHRIMIRDSRGRPVSEGTAGEIMIQGPGMFEGYVNVAGTFGRETWFASGDTGMVKDSILYIRGRSCSAIHVAGMKVFPEEIEACLLSHPAIKAARVYGTDHPRMGKVVNADISVKDGAELPEKELFMYCHKHLSPWKIPANWNIGAEIEKTSSGKVRRKSE